MGHPRTLVQGKNTPLDGQTEAQSGEGLLLGHIAGTVIQVSGWLC
jgi:hypothetical protein